MPDISVSIDSRDVQATLTRAPNQVSQAMRGGMEDATTYVLARIRAYPRQRPGSSYRRTGTLNRSWSRRISGTGSTIRGLVGSNAAIAPYNRYVQSRTHQARIHRGRWQTVESVAETERDTVVRMFQARFEAISR